MIRCGKEYFLQTKSWAPLTCVCECVCRPVRNAAERWSGLEIWQSFPDVSCFFHIEFRDLEIHLKVKIPDLEIVLF